VAAASEYIESALSLQRGVVVKVHLNEFGAWLSITSYSTVASVYTIEKSFSYQSTVVTRLYHLWVGVALPWQAALTMM